ncbi:MAG: nitroreductase [Lachnospiraceae bacterium]|nr:nitroreductase [Lachnospiraceae bacterium]
MTLQEAMKQRHTVRKYEDTPLPKDIVEKLNARVAQNNEKYDLNIKLITDDGKAIPGVFRLLMTKGVKNYFLLEGADRPDIDEQLGYCSTDIMLYAQTLGLNTWWVGGMYSKSNAQKLANAGNKVIGVVVVGYGKEQGVPHKSKSVAEVSSYDGAMPDWFKAGVEAALLAPTAMNHQAFSIKGQENQVSMTYANISFAGADLGISKYHFELGAGKENFVWK